MGENFAVHLVSNVSPQLFPNNNASKFSTHLADEIDVSNGRWEVAVRQIMYPTHVSTMTDSDKIFIHDYEDIPRHILPNINPKNIKDYTQLVRIIPLTPSKPIKDKKEMQKHLLNTINTCLGAETSKIVKAQISEGSEKFILHVYIDELAIMMTKATSQFLGYKKQTTFLKGTTWSWSSIQMNLLPETNFNLYILDYSYLEKQKYVAIKVKNYDDNTYFYRASIPKQENSDYDLQLDIIPEKGIVALYEMYPIEMKMKTTTDNTFEHTHHLKHTLSKSIAFIEFDKLIRADLEMQSMYSVNSDFEVKYKQLQVTTSKAKVFEDESYHSASEVGDFENFIGRQVIEVSVYYKKIRKFRTQIKAEPTHMFDVSSKAELKHPRDILKPLNIHAKLYDYTFTYDIHLQRFKLRVGNKHPMKLSKTLASILGFDKGVDNYFWTNTVSTATDFPTLTRAITALYVYSNIVDSVYVGDVKAPLLLTCPFTKADAFNVVLQQEFQHPCYVPLNRSRVQQIDIAIYDDAGELVPFVYGKTKLTLDFRRKK